MKNLKELLLFRRALPVAIISLVLFTPSAFVVTRSIAAVHCLNAGQVPGATGDNAATACTWDLSNTVTVTLPDGTVIQVAIPECVGGCTKLIDHPGLECEDADSSKSCAPAMNPKAGQKWWGDCGSLLCTCAYPITPTIIYMSDVKDAKCR